MSHPASGYDAVIVGGGHNGLVCACYLAAAGLAVRGIRAPRHRRRCGGHRGISSRISQFDRELHGQPAASEGHPRSCVSPSMACGLSSGRSPISCRCRTATISRSAARSPRRRARWRAFSRRDAAMLPAYYAMLERVADVLRELLLETPPNVGGGIRDLCRRWKVGGRLQQLVAAARRDLLDLFTKSAGDLLDAVVRVRSASRPRSDSMPSSAISRAPTRRVPRTCCCITCSARSTASAAHGDTRWAAWARSRRRWPPRRERAASRCSTECAGRARA